MEIIIIKKFGYFISESPNFSCMGFFRKYSIVRRSTPLTHPALCCVSYKNQSLDLHCKSNDLFLFFLTIWVLFHEHSRITGLQGKEEGIPLTPHYHFHPLYRHLDISRAITAESSPLHIASNRTRTWNLWFPSASR